MVSAEGGAAPGFSSTFPGKQGLGCTDPFHYQGPHNWLVGALQTEEPCACAFWEWCKHF